MADLKEIPGGFYEGEAQVSAGDLNEVVDASIRQVTGDGPLNVRKFGNRIAISYDGNQIIPPNNLQPCVVLEEFDDYLVCAPIEMQSTNLAYDITKNASTPEDERMYVAKPYLLQKTPWNNKTAGGFTFVYPGTIGRRTANGVTQNITPNYYVGDIILATCLATGYSFPNPDFDEEDEDSQEFIPVVWTDTNTGGRVFSALNSAGPTGTNITNPWTRYRQIGAMRSSSSGVDGHGVSFAVNVAFTDLWPACMLNGGGFLTPSTTLGGVLYAMPFIWHKDKVITHLAVCRSGAAFGTTIEGGLYANISGTEDYYYPGSRLAGGVINNPLMQTDIPTATGNVRYWVLPIDVSVDAGKVYWFVLWTPINMTDVLSTPETYLSPIWGLRFSQVQDVAHAALMPGSWLQFIPNPAIAGLPAVFPKKADTIANDCVMFPVQPNNNTVVPILFYRQGS